MAVGCRWFCTAVMFVTTFGEVWAQSPCPPPSPSIAGRQTRRFMTDPPGSAFHPQYLPGPYPPYMHAQGVPAFNWGYFGARSRRVGLAHSDYYGEASDWFYPRQ